MNITESEVTLISENTEIEGCITCNNSTRINGKIKGNVISGADSQLIISGTALVHGNIYSDLVIIDGFVQGDIRATKKVVISATGRVIGSIETPSLDMDFGAYFEGKCLMEKDKNKPKKQTKSIRSPLTAS